jgi:hypothetical protein
MIYIVCRSRRTAGSSLVSSPAIETTPTWARIIDFVTGLPGTDLLTHSQRLRVWVGPWFAGMAAPVISYTATTTTDIISAQCFAITGGKLDDSECIDQAPADFNIGASSTTVLGPTAALPANCTVGALALVLLSHEFNVTSGAATTVSGDGLTWVEAAEGVGTTVSFQAWANDYALCPTSQAITAKSSTNTAHTTGKSANVLMTLAPAMKASGLMPASAF